MPVKKAAAGCIFLILSSLLHAHSPSRHEIQLNKETRSLKVTAFHSVGNPEKHFVFKMVLVWNGVELVTEKFTRQTNDQYQEKELIIPSSIDIRQGDEIAVTSYCNKFGKKKTAVRVE